MKNFLHLAWSLLGLLACSTIADGQTVSMPTSGVVTNTSCSGTLLDPGGASNYPVYTSSQFVINPGGNASIQLQFTSFAMGSSDYIRVYNGPTTGYTYTQYNNANQPSLTAPITISDGVLILFYSGCCGSSAGFSMNWTASGATNTVLPGVSVVGGLSKPFGTPFNFINGGIGGSVVQWNFGDGNTSTENNPTHTYALPGTYNVTLELSNCTQSVVSSPISVTVQPAPTVSIAPDTVHISVPCDQTGFGSYTITKTSGSNLTINQIISDPFPQVAFGEDFEGTPSFTNNTTTAVAQVLSGFAPNGSSYYQFSGYASASAGGAIAQYPAVDPDRITFHYRASLNPTSYGNIVSFENINSSGSIFPLLSFYTYNGNIMAYTGNPVSFGTILAPVVLNQWYYIELVKTSPGVYSLYLDGNLITASFAMTLNPLQLFNRVALRSNNSTVFAVDNIRLFEEFSSSVLVTPATISNTSSTLIPITVSVNASNLSSGMHYFLSTISTNTIGSPDSVWIAVNVGGSPQYSLSASCMDLDSVFVNNTVTDSVLLVNTGCYAFSFTSVNVSGSAWTAGIAAPITMNEGDSLWIPVSFVSPTVGLFQDTLILSGVDTTLRICLEAFADQIPSLSLPASLSASVVGCVDSIPLSFAIGNTGLGTLNYQITQVDSVRLEDNFTTGLNSQLWNSSQSLSPSQSYCNGASTDQSIIFTGTSSSRRITTLPFDLSRGAILEFEYSRGASCNAPESNEGIYVQYSLDGLNYINYPGAYFYSFSNGVYQASVTIPAGFFVANASLRITQFYNSGGTLDMWEVDDVSLRFESTSGAANSLTPNPGNVAPNSSTTLNGQLYVGDLSSGTHTLNIIVSSNDPLQPQVTIPVSVTVDGQAILNSLPCVNLPAVLVGDALSDSLMIINSGCEDVTNGALTSSNPDLQWNVTSGNIAIGDTAYFQFTYVPTGAAGAGSDTLYVTTPDSVYAYCVNWTKLDAPSASLQNDSVFLQVVGCQDSISFTNTLYNTGLGTMNWQQIAGTAGDLQAVLDTIVQNAPGWYNTLLPSMYAFSEGISGTGINDGGGDMYDGGNYLNTNLGTFIPYSNNLITNNTSFGTNGAYFTYKSTGMFFMVADMDAVSSFYISGNAGADGSGFAGGTEFTTTFLGTPYKGFYKKIYNAGDPSINQLIIVPNPNPNTAQAYSTYTDNADQTISNLQGVNRIYYILWAGNSGYNYSFAQVQVAFDTFVQKLGSAGANWVIAPSSGTLSANDSVTLNLTLDISNLVSGTYELPYLIQTNDPNNPVLVGKVSLDIQGEAIYNGPAACVNLGTLLQGQVATDTVTISNTGCADLVFTSWSSPTGNLSATAADSVILPNQSTSLYLSGQFSSLGAVTDSLVLQFANGLDTTICINALINGAPLIGVTPDSLYFDVYSCGGTDTSNLVLTNSGAGTGNFSAVTGLNYTGSSSQNFTATSGTTSHSFVVGGTNVTNLTITMVLNGDFSSFSERADLQIEGYTYFPYDNNILDGVNDTVVYTITNVTDLNSIFADGVININVVNSTSVGFFTGYQNLHYIEIQVTGPAPNWISMPVSTGVLFAGGTTSVPVIVNPAGLSDGTYVAQVTITPNNVDGLPLVVPVVMNVSSDAHLVASTACATIPFTNIGDTTSGYVQIFNQGCSPLTITSITSPNAAFSAVLPSTSIAPGASYLVEVLFHPTAIGALSVNLTVNSAVGSAVICAQGTGGALPVADFDFTPTNACNGTFLFQDNSTNSPTFYDWNFGDGNTGIGSSVVHSYLYPGVYQVSLIVYNSSGSDTIVRSVNATSAFYVGFGVEDTVLIGQPAVFTDSSQIATGWNWVFGDGTTSTSQNPTHVYNSLGAFNVSLTATNGSCTKIRFKTIYVVSGIGVNDWTQTNLSIYPNPSTGSLRILAQGEVYGLEVYSLTGAKLYEYNGNHLEREQFSMDLPVGTYLVRVTSSEGYTKTFRWMVQ